MVGLWDVLVEFLQFPHHQDYTISPTITWPRYYFVHIHERGMLLLLTTTILYIPLAKDTSLSLKCAACHIWQLAELCGLSPRMWIFAYKTVPPSGDSPGCLHSSAPSATIKGPTIHHFKEIPDHFFALKHAFQAAVYSAFKALF